MAYIWFWKIISPWKVDHDSLIPYQDYDVKSPCDQNLKVEDGREGGNQEFEDGISDQYEDEVNITEIITIFHLPV